MELSEHDYLAEAKKKCQSGPVTGTIWKHYKGGLYMVVVNCVREADLVPCVVYVSLADGVYWSRPLDEWFAKVEHEGQTVARFWPWLSNTGR